MLSYRQGEPRHDHLNPIRKLQHSHLAEKERWKKPGMDFLCMYTAKLYQHAIIQTPPSTNRAEIAIQKKALNQQATGAVD